MYPLIRADGSHDEIIRFTLASAEWHGRSRIVDMNAGDFYDDRDIYYSLTSNDEGRAVLRTLVGAGALHMLVTFQTVQLLYQNHFLSGQDLRNIMDYCDEHDPSWRHQH